MIPFIPYRAGIDQLSDIGMKLDKQDGMIISDAFSPGRQSKPTVHLALGHAQDVIFLKYCVSEKYIVAIHQGLNEPIHEDTLVPFLIRFADEVNYYELVFSPVGLEQEQYVPGNTNQQLLNLHRVEMIDTSSTIKINQQQCLLEWELTAAIPTAVFEFHSIVCLDGMNCSLCFLDDYSDLPAVQPTSMQELKFSHLRDFRSVVFEGSGI